MNRIATRVPWLVLAIGGCRQPDPASAQNTAAAPIETVAVVSRTLNTVDRLPGSLAPYETVGIQPKVTGFLDEIRVDVGSKVRKGDVLMKLSAPELRAQRAQAEAALQAAESQLTSAQAKLTADQGTYERVASAAETPGVVAANDLAIAKQSVEADRGNVLAAEHHVSAAHYALRALTQTEEYLTIHAPFSGTITQRALHPGALVGPGSGESGARPIVQLVDTERLRLIVPVPEAEVGAIQSGQQVAFSVPMYLGETFRAPVARISHAIDLQTRTMHIELDVHNADGRLSPGSFASVAWPVTRAYPSLFVPVSAVTSDQQRTFVIRLIHGTAEWVTVQTGQTIHGEIEVVGELHPGDEVVRNATDSIRDGDKIDQRRTTGTF